jgi:tetratricopeptide (TPR) repeat protein
MALYAKVGRTEEARKLEQEALNLAPPSRDVYIYLDLISKYMAVEAVADAERLGEQALRVDPDKLTDGVLEKLTAFYRKIKDETKRREVVEKRLKRLEEPIAKALYAAGPFVSRAWLRLREADDVAGAAADAERARALSLPGQEPHTLLGWVYLRKGELAAAIASFKEADRLAAWSGVETDKEILYGLGLALVASGEVEEGRALVRRALVVDPDHPAAEEAKEVVEGN